MARTYGKAQDLIDFTRASGGTALRRVKYGAELVTNGTFDSADNWTLGTGWSISGGVAVGTSTSVNINQTIGSQIGKILIVEFDLVNTSGSIMRAEVGGYKGETMATSGHYVSALAPSTTADKLFIYGANFTGTIDNVSVKEVIFDTSDGDLILFNHPNNVPRIEYDANGNVLGLLVEESRTNLIPYSDLSSNWTEFNATKTISSVEAPNGDLMYELNATATGVPTGTVTTYSSTSGTYTVSAILKAGTTNYAFVGISDNATGQAEIRFNLSSGTYDTTNVGFVGSWTNVSGSIVNLGNGFYRCSTTGTQGAGNPVSSRIIAGAPDGSRSQTVINTKLYATGAQLESGSFMTSLIPTSGSTATRSADVASLSTSAFGYNDEAGSLVVDAKYLARNVTNRYGRVAGLATSTTERFGIYDDPNSTSDYIRYYARNDSAAAILGPNNLAGSDQLNVKIAFGFAKDSLFITGGGEQASSSSGTFSTTIEKVWLGSETGNSQFINGHIKSLKLYPRRLTNAQLQELTS